VVVSAQRNVPLGRLIGVSACGFSKALQIAAAPHFHGDRQFISLSDCAYCRVGGRLRRPNYFLRIFRVDIDELHTKSPSDSEVERKAQRQGSVTVMSCSSGPSQRTAHQADDPQNADPPLPIRQSPAGYVGEMGVGDRHRFAGSETYSRNVFDPPAAVGAVKDSVPSACRYRFVACALSAATPHTYAMFEPLWNVLACQFGFSSLPCK